MIRHIVNSQFKLVVIVLLCSSFMPKQQEVPKKLNPDNYLRWVDSARGLQAREKIGMYDLVLKYHPDDYMILKENQMDALSRREWKAKRKDYKNVEYYSFFIASADGKKNVVKNLAQETNSDFNTLVKYLAYDVQKDITLIQGTDTLSCSFIHMEETFEVTPYVRYILAFNTPDTSSKDQEDRILKVSLPLIDQKVVQLRIKREEIESIPQVSIKHL